MLLILRWITTLIIQVQDNLEKQTDKVFSTVIRNK
jgi:hypothetical protein